MRRFAALAVLGLTASILATSPKLSADQKRAVLRLVQTNENPDDVVAVLGPPDRKERVEANREWWTYSISGDIEALLVTTDPRSGKRWLSTGNTVKTGHYPSEGRPKLVASERRAILRLLRDHVFSNPIWPLDVVGAVGLPEKIESVPGYASIWSYSYPGEMQAVLTPAADFRVYPLILVGDPAPGEGRWTAERRAILNLINGPLGSSSPLKFPPPDKKRHVEWWTYKVQGGTKSYEVENGRWSGRFETSGEGTGSGRFASGSSEAARQARMGSPASKEIREYWVYNFPDGPESYEMTGGRHIGGLFDKDMGGGTHLSSLKMTGRNAKAVTLAPPWSWLTRGLADCQGKDQRDTWKLLGPPWRIESSGLEKTWTYRNWNGRKRITVRFVNGKCVGSTCIDEPGGRARS